MLGNHLLVKMRAVKCLICSLNVIILSLRVIGSLLVSAFKVLIVFFRTSGDIVACDSITPANSVIRKSRAISVKQVNFSSFFFSFLIFKRFVYSYNFIPSHICLIFFSKIKCVYFRIWNQTANFCLVILKLHRRGPVLMLAV